MTKVKAYTFGIILYLDSTSYNYNKVIDYIESNYDLYAYIKHKPEEDDSKYHTHVIIKFPNKRYNTSVAKELGIEDNYIQKVNLNAYLKYLIHYDDEDKIQYPVSEVHGTLKNKLIDLISNNSEESNFNEIMLYLQNNQRLITFKELTQYCMVNNMFSCYRRNLSALKLLLKEHNENIFNQDY